MFFPFFPLKVRLPYHFECLVVKISMSSWNLSFEELEIFDHLEGKKMFIIFVYVYIYIYILKNILYYLDSSWNSSCIWIFVIHISFPLFFNSSKVTKDKKRKIYRSYCFQ